MRLTISPALAVLAMCALLGTDGRAKSDVVVEPEGEKIRVEIGPATRLVDVLEACRPHLDHHVYYRTPLESVTVSSQSFTVDRADLWLRLEPILRAAEVVWIPAGPDQVSLWEIDEIGDQGLANRAPFVPLSRLRNEAEAWSENEALVVTTLVPVEKIEPARAARQIRGRSRWDRGHEALAGVPEAGALVATGPIWKLLALAREVDELEAEAEADDRVCRTYELRETKADVAAFHVEIYLKGLAKDAKRGEPPFSPERVFALPGRIVVHARPSVLGRVTEIVEELEQGQ